MSEKKWSRAVWLENKLTKQEEEGTVPSNWVIEGSLYWPPVVDAKPFYESRSPPNLQTWRKFKLIKIKFQSGTYVTFNMHLYSCNRFFEDNEEECAEYDNTTADDEEECTRAKKRKRHSDFHYEMDGSKEQGKGILHVHVHK